MKSFSENGAEKARSQESHLSLSSLLPLYLILTKICSFHLWKPCSCQSTSVHTLIIGIYLLYWNTRGGVRLVWVDGWLVGNSHYKKIPMESLGKEFQKILEDAILWSLHFQPQL